MNARRPARAPRPVAPHRRRLECERRILAQDRLLERAQVAAGLDADLVDQPATSGTVTLERFGLPAVTVQRQHQLTSRALIEWLRRQRALEIRDELVMTPECERDIDALGHDRPALIVKRIGGGARVAFQRDVAQRVASPEAERLVERAKRVFAARCLARAARRLHELVEAAGVELAGRRRDRVPGRPGRDQRRIAERDANPQDVLVHHVAGTPWRGVPPDAIDQLLDRDDRARVQEQHAQQRTLAPASEPDLLSVDRGLEGPEDTES